MTDPAFLREISLSSHIIIPTRLNTFELETIMERLEGRKVTFLRDTEYVLDESLKATVNSLPMIEFSSIEKIQVRKELQKALTEGGVVLFLPPRCQVSIGNPLDIPTPSIEALCQLGLPLAPLAVHRSDTMRLRTDDLAGDGSSSLVPGKVFQEQTSFPRLFQETLSCIEEAFSSRSFLKSSFPAHLLRSLHVYGDQNKVIDGGDDTELCYKKLLAASLALSDHIKKVTTKKRVGIVLTPGKGGLIANLAVCFAGKIPVNLNFTAPKKAIDFSINEAGIDRLISANALIEKLPEFPWLGPESMVLLDELKPKLKRPTLIWILKLKFLSSESIIKQRNLEDSKNHDEALLLFTSGSSGQPKGVPLSHRNMLANICQFSSRVRCDVGDKVMGCLPLFHAFGSTATTFFPLLQGFDLVTYPSPLETKKIGELIEKHKVTLFTATPTFLRGYIRRVEPHQLASLKHVVTGAEKLPKSLADTFAKRFNKHPLEGYGLTETSPASYLNTHSQIAEGETVLESCRAQTVGYPLPGVAMKVTDPTTNEDLPLNEAGTLWLKGANIFRGYLNKEELNEEILQGEWFNTGDIARIDQDGFVTLEGRISRFSKIAGEMVPHEGVEEEVNKILDLVNVDERKTAIIGVPDEKKGEALVLLTSLSDVASQELKKSLISQGVPALWCPKVIVQVPEIPMLATGKLDIAECHQVVRSSLG